MSLLDSIKKDFSVSMIDWSLEDYLSQCRENSSLYASPSERILKAIGEPELIDTKLDDRLCRIYSNKVIKRYPAFAEFYGMEETIEQIVSFFKHAAQGLEEKKQILYLLGPVGGGKSSLAERLKQLMEQSTAYVLVADGEVSPVWESPLGLFSGYKEQIEAEYGIPKRYIPACPSPWATKRLMEYGGDVSKFRVRVFKLSISSQIGIAKNEPGDENNQDISSLVGKVDIRKLAEFPQNDADAYNYSGALCKANQGMMEFVEMFKAPIKVLHPLLTATQEGNYNGTESLPSIPFQGIILAHSNESEWEVFSNDKKNEAFLDRVNIVRVPYCLRVDEEVAIYQKLIKNSSLADAPCAPMTLDLLAQFSVLTRLRKTENSSLYSKMRIYNGENLKEIDLKAKSLQEYRDDAGITEGMQGISTRFAFKVLSKVFNHDSEEIAANPVHLFYVLEQEVIKLQLPKETEDFYLNILKSMLSARYAEFIGDEIQKAYVDSYQEYGQNLFERYITYADYWCQDNEYRDPETGEQFDRQLLNAELEKIEKPAGIANPKDFRNDVVQFYLRYRAKNGISPRWDSYEKIKNVIEKRIFSKTEDLIPVISFSSKASRDEEKKHSEFIERMHAKGYTFKQIKLLTEWYLRVRKSN
ncbi:MAG: PrkA family serine protein kinase [Crocinitomicaceae bacterium]|jgi:serine protein kinase